MLVAVILYSTVTLSPTLTSPVTLVAGVAGHFPFLFAFSVSRSCCPSLPAPDRWPDTPWRGGSPGTALQQEYVRFIFFTPLVMVGAQTINPSLTVKRRNKIRNGTCYHWRHELNSQVGPLSRTPAPKTATKISPPPLPEFARRPAGGRNLSCCRNYIPAVYFCQAEDTKRFDLAETIPARQHRNWEK